MPRFPHRSPSLLRALLCATLLALPPGAAFAGGENSLRSGATAIQFQALGWGGSRSTIRTMGIYLKQHLAERSALRIGADFSVDNASSDRPQVVPVPPVGSSRSSSQTAYAAQAALEFLRYLEGEGPFTMYVGVGPVWSWYNRVNEYTHEYDTSDTTVVVEHGRDESRSWTIGATASVGFEWFVVQRLSVLGRMGASLGFGERSSYYKYTVTGGTSAVPPRTSDSKSSVTVAGTDGVMLGFSAYF